MTAVSLKRVVAAELADIGVDAPEALKGRPRATVWLDYGVGRRSYASGRTVYVVQARMGGRSRTITLGVSTVLTEAQALAVGRRVQAHAIVGDNPAETRAQVRAAPSWTAFVKEYWRAAAPGWEASTRATHGVYRRRYLDAAFAGATIDTIDTAQVARWFARLTDTAGPGGANRCIEIFNAMMRKAESWGYRPDGSNPCASIRRNRRRKMERYLSKKELARLGAVLEAERTGCDAYRRSAANVVLMLALTGCRRSEILDLQRSDVRGARLYLRDSKVGPRTVWLSEEARAVVTALPRHKTSPYLFMAHSRRTSAGYLNSFWKEVCVSASIRRCRLHDLRHTFASHAAQSGETLPMIGRRMLGHASIQSTARYAHLDDSDVQDAAEVIGRKLKLLLSDDH